MSATEPASPAGTQAPSRHRNYWIWACALLVLCCAGLAIWAFSLNSDLDDTQAQVDSLQTQVTEQEQTGDTVVAGLQAAYAEFAQQLGASRDDLTAAKQDITSAKQELEAADAKAAEAAQGAQDDVQAQLDEAEAKADGAAAKTQIAGNCAKAYVSAFGALFEGDSVRAQVATVGQQLQSITADCRTALGGT